MKIDSIHLQPLIDYALHDGHRQVEGWLGDGALGMTMAISQHQIALGMKGAVGEIGVHHGRFLIALALLKQPTEKVIAIDVFEDQHLNVDWSGSGSREILLLNLQKFGVMMNDIVIHKADSLQMSSSQLLGLSEQYFRLFSVDGGHQVANVLNDIGIVTDVLAPKGVIILDDFFNPDWPGVNEGFFQFMAHSSSLAPFCYGDNKIFLCQKNEHIEWIEWIQQDILSMCAYSKKVMVAGYVAYHLHPPSPNITFLS